MSDKYASDGTSDKYASDLRMKCLELASKFATTPLEMVEIAKGLFNFSLYESKYIPHNSFDSVLKKSS